MSKNICAIIVTWNADKDDLERTIPAASHEADSVVVVDNGSLPENFAALKKITEKFTHVTIIQNTENKGIGNAFNRGAEYALKKGFEWFITLDDNGKMGERMLGKLLEAYDNLAEKEQAKTAIVAPNYTTLKGRVYEAENPFFVQTTVATGQMIKTKAWKEVKGFKEDLFIACVDHEFCFKILRAGYKTLLVPSTMLYATAGPKPIVRSLFGKKFVVPNYSPDRYYYTYRNSMYLYKMYWRHVPGWIIKNIISNKLTFLKILFFEEQKFKKILMIIQGCWDGLRNKLGKLKQ